MASARVMVVEDEDDIASLIEHNLRLEGYDTQVCKDGIEALEAVRQRPPDLMLLDIMLPGIDGKSVCRLVRRDHEFPIIMVSARTSELDKVVGLEVGADDYIEKPFSILELMARVRAALRRASVSARPQDAVLKVGQVTLDRGRHVVMVRGREVQLRPKEFLLLETLMASEGLVLERECILERVWGEAEYIDAGTVDVHVRRLREKIEESPNEPRHILTVRGFGYKFSASGS